MGENETTNQGQNQDAGRRPWNALDEWKLRLQGRVLDGGRKPSTFKLAMIANQLRFQAFTNIENDPTGGKVEAKLGSIDMFAVLRAVEMAASSREFKIVKIPCYTGPEADQKLESTLVIGRDSEQCVIIGIEPGEASSCKNKMVFQLMPSSYHTMLRADGQEASKAEISEYWAYGWVSLMRSLTASVLTFNGKDRAGQENVNGDPIEQQQKKPWQGNGGGGGYQKKPWQGKGGGGGGGYQKKPWQGNGGGGGYQKKPWQGNGGGDYQKKPWQGNNQNQSQSYSGDIEAGGDDGGFNDNMPF